MDIDKFLHKKGMKPNQTIEVHLNGDKNRVLIIGLKDLLKQYKQALNLTDVSQQREPLLAYHKHLDSFNDPTIYNASESMIDDYLDNNCG